MTFISKKKVLRLLLICSGISLILFYKGLYVKQGNSTNYKTQIYAMELANSVNSIANENLPVFAGAYVADDQLCHIKILAPLSENKVFFFDMFPKVDKNMVVLEEARFSLIELQTAKYKIDNLSSDEGETYAAEFGAESWWVDIPSNKLCVDVYFLSDRKRQNLEKLVENSDILKLRNTYNKAKDE